MEPPVNLHRLASLSDLQVLLFYIVWNSSSPVNRLIRSLSILRWKATVTVFKWRIDYSYVLHLVACSSLSASSLTSVASVESEEAEAPPLLFVGAGSSSTAGQLGSVIEYLTGPKRGTAKLNIISVTLSLLGERAIHSTTVAIAKLRRCGIPYHKQQVEGFVTKVTWNTSTETFV